jgi:membrane associated rhomboid family serine protease
MIIPLKDNVRTDTVPIIAASLILVNIFIYVWFGLLDRGNGADMIERYGFVPADLLHALTSRPQDIPVNFVRTITSTFLHGGILHLLGNMWFLWIFGNNVEDVLGHARVIPFYMLSGAVAALVQFSVDPFSNVPMIGASGAVSGILGAYLVLFPRARVKTLLFLFVFITTLEVPAVVLLTIWFVLQVLGSQGTGVAWFAHIGGFVFGLVTIRVFAIGKWRRARGQT